MGYQWHRVLQADGVAGGLSDGSITIAWVLHFAIVIRPHTDERHNNCGVAGNTSIAW